MNRTPRNSTQQGRRTGIKPVRTCAARVAAEPRSDTDRHAGATDEHSSAHSQCSRFADRLREHQSDALDRSSMSPSRAHSWSTAYLGRRARGDVQQTTSLIDVRVELGAGGSPNIPGDWKQSLGT